MAGRFLGLFFLLSLLVSCSHRPFSVFSDLFLPNAGLVELGEVEVRIIGSPFIRNEGAIIGEKAREEWKKIADRKWLSVTLKNSPTVEISISEIPPRPPFNYSYSVYVSRRVAARGFLLSSDSRINFAYFTINIDNGESGKIEARRDWLNHKSRAREKIRIRGKLVRFETTALDLFEKAGERTIEFIDFYLADIEFLEN